VIGMRQSVDCVAVPLAALLRLAAERDSFEDRLRRGEAVPEPDPQNQRAALVLLVLDQKRPTS